MTLGFSDASLSIRISLCLNHSGQSKYNPITRDCRAQSHQKTKCFVVKGRTVAGGASQSTPSALTSYVSGST